MSKKNSELVCTECGQSTNKWVGRCTSCFSWNTIETVEKDKNSKKAEHKQSQKLVEVQKDQTKKRILGVSELDNCFGGGLAEGSFNLISGDPGVGKSTLLMEICKCLKDEKIIYISAEESKSQVAMRAKRIKLNSQELYVLHETSWQLIVSEIKMIRPKFVILDSIQTVHSQEVSSSAGSVTQVREITHELLTLCKGMGITTFVVGHVTKDGSIAGPKILEHMVDTVLHFEGERETSTRILRVVKNRFGPTNEVGLFEMNEGGLEKLINMNSIFENNVEKDNVYGRAIACTIEGTRVLFFEVESLVIENKFGNAKRVTQGIDQNRLNILIAIIEKYFEIPLSLYDIYVNTVGGIKNNSRETDIALIAAILSSYYSKVVRANVLCLGEVGLTGEVKKIKNLELRLKSLVQNSEYTLLSAHKVSDMAKEYNAKFVKLKCAKELKQHIFV